jgi:tripartite-type tricarboxylate transporter receptor subunit TctC
MFAPAKTPAPVVKRIQEAVHRALQQPAVNRHFVDNGYEPQGDPPAEWAKQFRADVKRFAEIARLAKIEPQ